MAWDLIVYEKMHQDYQGRAEMCTYTFSLGPEQFPGMKWAAQKVIDTHVKELTEQGSQLLELRVWEDIEPTWTTDYYVEVVATASPLWWNIIIGGVLLLLIGIAILFTIKEVKEITKYVGEEAPVTLPLMAIAGIGILVLVGLYMVKKR